MENKKDELKESMIKTMLIFLQEEKIDLEERGLIPTIDEVINDLQEQMSSYERE